MQFLLSFDHFGCICFCVLAIQSDILARICIRRKYLVSKLGLKHMYDAQLIIAMFQYWTYGV